MKKRLTRFLNSVANLARSQQPALVTAKGGLGSKPTLTKDNHPITLSLPITNENNTVPQSATVSGLTNYPPLEKWDDWACVMPELRLKPSVHGHGGTIEVDWIAKRQVDVGAKYSAKERKTLRAAVQNHGGQVSVTAVEVVRVGGLYIVRDCQRGAAVVVNIK